MMFLAQRYCRNYFSVINKIRKRQSMKYPSMQRVKTKPHQLKDEIGNVKLQQKRMHLTPYQQYLIQTKSMQRPFTGNLWGQISAGFYHCAVCNTRLFTFAQKFKSQSGFASFFDCVQKRVNILDQKANFDLVNIFPDPFVEEQIKRHKRCECAQCKAHIGAVMFDGPYPTFLRFSINSNALVFKQMQDFQDPNIARIQKVKKKQEKVIRYIN